MQLGKHSPVIIALFVVVTTTFLVGCIQPHQPGPAPVEPSQPPASQPAAPTSQPTTQASQPATPTSRPAITSQPALPVRRPAPAAPEGTASGALLPRDMPAHPFMLFTNADVATLAKRKGRDPLLQDCWDKLAELAAQPDQMEEWWDQLEARAFLAIMTDDKAMAKKAIDLMRAGLAKTDPGQFYEIGAANFHVHAAPLRALALAWDWLYGYMTPAAARRDPARPGALVRVLPDLHQQAVVARGLLQRRVHPDRRPRHPRPGHPRRLRQPRCRPLAP